MSTNRILVPEKLEPRKRVKQILQLKKIESGHQVATYYSGHKRSPKVTKWPHRGHQRSPGGQYVVVKA